MVQILICVGSQIGGVLMPKAKKNNDWKKKRLQGHLKPKEYHFIFCEGDKTEPNYFKSFKDLIDKNPIYRGSIQITIRPSVGETTYIVKTAEKYIVRNNIKIGHVWCVYDKDEFPARKFNEVVERIDNLNQKKTGICYHSVWSNECIEFWFILHFAYYKTNNHRNEYVSFLEKYLGHYEKNMKNIFDQLIEKGNPQLAIRRAKEIIKEGCNRTPAQIAPGTKVYELVEALSEYLPQEVRCKFLKDH